MIIGKIEDGIVLDHIKAGQGMRLYNILGLDKLECEVALIQNAPSQKLGRKDILKIGASRSTSSRAANWRSVSIWNCRQKSWM